MTGERTARFSVDGVRIDGQSSARVEIVVGGRFARGVVRVKPYRRRTTYSLPLPDVAEMVAHRAAKLGGIIPGGSDGAG